MELLEQKYVDRYCNYQLTGNFFENFNPLSKLNILLVMAFSALVMQDYRYGLGLCAFYYLFSIVFGKFKEFNKTFFKLIIVIGIFIVVIRQITVKPENPTVLLSIFGWNWTWEALVNGLNMGTIILGFSGAIVLFYAFTTMRDLMYSLEQKGVPHSTSYVMLASFQTIIDLRANVVTILESQKSRGIETEGGPLTRIKAFFPVISPLLLGALSSSEEKFVAMDARAFSVKRKHTFLRELRPTPIWEKVIVILVDVAFLVLCGLKIYFTFFAGRGA